MTAVKSDRRGARRLGRFLTFMVRGPAQASSASDAADRALVNIWSLWRFATIAVYAPGFPVHRSERRTAWVIPTIVAGQVLEGVWVHRRIVGGNRIMQTIGVDAAVAATTIAASALDMTPSAVETDVQWPDQLGTTTAALGGMFLPLPQAIALAAGLDLLSAAMKSVIADPNDDRRVRPLWVYLGNLTMARTLAGVTRTLAAEVDDYRATAAELGAGVGRLAESHRVSEVAIDRSLEVLAGLQAPEATPELASMRSSAAFEALRLRAILDDDPAPQGFARGLWDLAGESAARGVTVELLTREVGAEPEEAPSEAIHSGVGSALRTLAASTDTTRAVVRVRARSGRLVCTVRSRRPVGMQHCVQDREWQGVRAAILALGGTVSDPGTGPCEDPEWRFEVPCG